MQFSKEKSIIEAILFAAGRPVTKNEIMLALEISRIPIMPKKMEYVNIF